MGTLNEKSDEKHGHLSIDPYQVDTGAQLVSGDDSPLDLTESLRIRYVLVRRVSLELTNSNEDGK